MPQEQNIPSQNFFLIIPAHIANDFDIDDSTKLLYGRIVSLSNKEGYCWASDKYIADMCGVKDRVISDRLKALEDKGYIHRETTKIGMYWDRKIYPIFENKKMFTKSTTVPYRVAQPCPTEAHVHAVEQEKLKQQDKQQQQQGNDAVAAASFHSENLEQRKPLVYRCLIDVDIPKPDKIEITSRYDEKTAENALQFSITNKDKITSTFVAYLKMACSKGLKIINKTIHQSPIKTELTEEEEFQNRSLAQNYKKTHWDNLKIRQSIDDKVSYVQINNDKIYYKDVKFKELFQHALRKIDPQSPSFSYGV